MDASKDRHALRLQLLERGFLPLPLNGKACYVPGWSHCPVDAAFLEAHRRKGAWSNTGIRCGNVVAIDIDCDDADLAEVIEDCVEEFLGPTEWARVGRAPRVLLLYWTDAPLGKLRTGRYGGQQVEVLGKGCQFVAYGVHPTTGGDYRWIGTAEPLNQAVDDLPAVTGEQLRGLVAKLETLLEATGRPLESKGGDLHDTPQHDYCLTDAMEFDCLDLGVLTVAALRERLAPGDSIACNLTAIRPDSDSKAGRASLDSAGGVCIADFVTGVVYFEAQIGAQRGLDALAAAIALEDAKTAQEGVGGVFELTPMQRVGWLLENYAYVASDDTVRRLDAPAAGTKRSFFVQQHRSYVGKKLLVNYWLEHGAITCAAAALLPDKPERVVEEVPGVRVLNTYVAPVFPEGGSTALFHDFLTGLIPVAVERALLLDWIACKVQRPWVRMHGMVIVAERSGTGRGTLVEILRRLIGPAYCKAVKLGHVFGSTYQSQYTDWLEGTLLTTVAEAQDLTRDVVNDWNARKRAYEAIKEAVETQAGAQYVVRKGVASGSAMVYTSLFIATNNPDALAIEEGDRRLIVLSGGDVRPPEFYAALWAWLDDGANVGALWRELRQRAIAYDPYAPPLETEAKRRMIDASLSDLDRAWQLFETTAPGDLFTAPQWLAFLTHCRMDLGYQFPDNLKAAGLAVLNRHGQRLKPGQSGWQMWLKERGISVRPWVLRNVEQWRAKVTNTPPGLGCEEILKNGDPTQKVGKINGPPW